MVGWQPLVNGPLFTLFLFRLMHRFQGNFNVPFSKIISINLAPADTLQKMHDYKVYSFPNTAQYRRGLPLWFYILINYFAF